MKRKISVGFIVLIFIVGIGIMSYPLISSVVNNVSSRNTAQAYAEKAEEMDTTEIDKLFAQADAYNKSLTNNIVLTDPFDVKAYESIGASYEQSFDVDGKGLIGYIDIPKINVYLPIYHGTSEEVLSKGAGHLANTSLPVGGKNTHSVISAHTAYPTETFFDYLTDMQEGDVFYVHVLTKTLKYEVDQIKVILPENTSDLYIFDDQDLVTLLTCTPYSINTHRLLVRGTRVPYTEEEGDNKGGNISTLSVGDGYLYFIGYKLPFWLVGIIIAGFVGIVAFIVIMVLRKSKKKKAKYLAENTRKKDDSNQSPDEKEGE